MSLWNSGLDNNLSLTLADNSFSKGGKLAIKTPQHFLNWDSYYFYSSTTYTLVSNVYKVEKKKAGVQFFKQKRKKGQQHFKTSQLERDIFGQWSIFISALLFLEESNDKDLSFKVLVCGHRISIFNYFPWMKYTGLFLSPPPMIPFLFFSPLGGQGGQFLSYPSFFFFFPEFSQQATNIL